MQLIYISISNEDTRTFTEKFPNAIDLQLKRFTKEAVAVVKVAPQATYLLPYGYIGCGNSHRIAWTTIAEHGTDDFFLICEQDVRLTPSMFQALEEYVDNHATPSDIIWCGNDINRSLRRFAAGVTAPLLVTSPAAFRFAPEMQMTHSCFYTHAYIVNRRGASTLLKNLDTIRTHVDAEISILHAAGAIDVATVPPALLVSQDYDVSDKQHCYRHTLHLVATLLPQATSRLAWPLFGLSMPNISIAGCPINAFTMLSLLVTRYVYDNFGPWALLLTKALTLTAKSNIGTLDVTYESFTSMLLIAPDFIFATCLRTIMLLSSPTVTALPLVYKLLRTPETSHKRSSIFRASVVATAVNATIVLTTPLRLLTPVAAFLACFLATV